MRHGNQCAQRVFVTEHGAQKIGVVIRLAGKRHHHRVDAARLEIGVVNHRRFEGVRGVADVGDDLG